MVEESESSWESKVQAELALIPPTIPSQDVTPPFVDVSTALPHLLAILQYQDIIVRGPIVNN